MLVYIRWLTTIPVESSNFFWKSYWSKGLGWAR